VVTSVAGTKPGRDEPTKGTPSKDTPTKDTATKGTPSNGGPAKGETDVQRRMREALEAKQARSKAGHGEDHLTGRRVGPSTNDKHQRQFRRKSG
jgi:hypothetical protein